MRSQRSKYSPERVLKTLVWVQAHVRCTVLSTLWCAGKLSISLGCNNEGRTDKGRAKGPKLSWVLGFYINANKSVYIWQRSFYFYSTFHHK